MRTPSLSRMLAIVGSIALALPTIAAVQEPVVTATPQAECGPGSRPETGLQGQVSQEDHDSGRAAEGFTCNTELVGSHRTLPDALNTFGTIGGFKTHRYVDAAGNECAYYDSTLLFPTNLGDGEGGVIVLDMSDPANPVETIRLVTPAMDQPHESLVISEERGILAAITGTLATNPGVLDVYDISEDCRFPRLMTSWTTITEEGIPLLGHESGLTPDGMTFWAASTATAYVFAIDISNEIAGQIIPEVLYTSTEGSHGLNLNDDGTRAYFTSGGDGMVVLDTTDIANRVEDPQVEAIGRLDWATRSIPQNAIPFTSGGSEFLFEVDEFGSCSKVGAARVINIDDETAPFVASDVRLEVHQPENFDAVCDDPGTQTPAIQGYAGHYCHIPTRVDPQIAACSFIVSGLRIFDISNPYAPVEIGYFNAPVQDRPVFDTPLTGGVFQGSNWAMSAPAFVPERNEIWYTDGFQGFYAIRVTNGMWNGAGDVDVPGKGCDRSGQQQACNPPTPTVDGTMVTASVSGIAAPGTLATSGAGVWLTVLGAVMLGAAAGIHLQRRRVRS